MSGGRPRWGARGLATLALLALVASGCTSTRALRTPTEAGADTRAGSGGARATEPPCTPASLEERAARTLIVGLPEVTETDNPLLDEVMDVGVGGVLLTHANVASSAQVRALVSNLERRAAKPLLVTVDEEPGRVRTFEELVGYVPSARRLASERTVEEVRDVGASTGRLLKGLGVDVNLAPVADVDGGPWNGIIGDRSFSDEPFEASRYALAYAQGLEAAGVTPVVKHFPGHGRSDVDSHVTNPEVSVSLDELLRTDVQPFKDLVAAGAPVVMMGHVAYRALEPFVPASLSAPAYRLLRDLGFKGAAITDSIGMGAVNLRWNYGDAAVKAVAAGADGVLGTDGWGARWMRDALVEAVNDGRLPESRLNEAAARMMALAGGDPQALTCSQVDLPALR